MAIVSVIGVPSSAGSYAAGQDQAPAALRAAGLIERLQSTGLTVADCGDLPVQVWRPDRTNPLCQNLDEVVLCLHKVADRLMPALGDSAAVLIVGGNCTVALAMMAALRDLQQGECGLAYIDRGWDINTPASTTDGALDWMGMGHALGLAGSASPLAEAFGPAPLLKPHQVQWLGVEPTLATKWERDQAHRLDLATTSSEEFAADPAGTSRAALAALPTGPLGVHLDVDVLDFTDAPLAENTDGRNTGPSLAQATVALEVVVADPRFWALSIGELNPTRSAGDPTAIDRFIDALAHGLGALER